MQDWRMTYNHRRPHSSLGGLTPAEFSTQCASVPEKVPPTAPPSPPLQHTDLLT
ncbi:integrase core domain-containing protein [Thalassoglobus neptunius]|uniref:integrase core domain-containing protein n=1 Tax=Thalassoglobus neptunius TaxID=1938619 RepID=UPI0036F1D117